MPSKYDIFINRCVSCSKNGIGVALLGVSALLSAGCLSLFDSPQSTQDVHQEVALKTMNKLASATPEDAMDKATDFGKAKAGNTADTVQQRAANATNRSGTSESGGAQEEKSSTGREVPSLSFERVNADMPHLAVWGLDNATMLVDGEQIELGKMTRAGRIALISAGHHRLQIRCPSDPPFSADFSVVKGDRVAVRGRCSSDRRTVADEGKRN